MDRLVEAKNRAVRGHHVVPRRGPRGDATPRGACALAAFGILLLTIGARAADDGPSTGASPAAKQAAPNAAPNAPQPDARTDAGQTRADDAKDAPAAADAPAAPPAAPRLYQSEPYDVLTLDKANDNRALKILPLPLPERRLPEPSKRIGKLKIRLFDSRADEYEVPWRSIEQVDLFEELVLREAGEVVQQAVALTAADKPAEAQAKYDEAFDYYQWLRRFHPHTAGLKEAIQDYLYLNAGALFRAGRVEEAFAILEELYDQNPSYQYQGGPQTVLAALERVGERLIGLQVEAHDYRAGRLLVQRLQRAFGTKLPVATQWADKLVALATAQRAEAAAHLAAGRFREAHEAGQTMLRIWPALPGGRELVLDIARQYPLVVVGVSQPAVTFDPTSLDNPAARRCGRLLTRTLVELVQPGPEGGAYASPWGAVQQSADRMELIFESRPQPNVDFSGYSLSSQLLAMADPTAPAYRPGWAQAMAAVTVQNVRRARVRLRRPLLLPQALLQVPLADPTRLGVRYRVAAQTDGETRFEPIEARSASGEPKPVVVERYYAEPRRAIEDLRKGKLDALDRLLPGDAQRLRSDDSLAVRAYAFPSLHVLAPNKDSPFLANRVFRRALLYGINREVILRKGLLNGIQDEGARVLSAPLPAGAARNDPTAYAYDETQTPLPYDPVMSAVLLRLANQQLAAAADKKKEPVPELKELVLAHPAGEMPGFICRQIQTQWEVIGVKCVLRELPPGQTRVADGKFDVLYAELALHEPLVDVGALFGPDGLGATGDPFINLAVRQLDEVANWKEARSALGELHRLLVEDVTLIPLWQMIDYFAYHNGLTGPRDRPIAFYQDVEHWRVAPPVQQE